PWPKPTPSCRATRTASGGASSPASSSSFGANRVNKASLAGNRRFQARCDRMELQAGRQRALLAVVGALSLGGAGCTDRVSLISSVTQLDAAGEPDDAEVAPDRPLPMD